MPGTTQYGYGVFRRESFVKGSVPGEAALINALAEKPDGVNGQQMSLLQQCNDANDLIYVQFTDPQKIDSRGKPEIVPMPHINYLKLKREIAKQDYIAFVAVDNFINEFISLRSDPKIEMLSLVQEVEGSRKFVFFDRPPKPDEEPLQSKSKICVTTKAYMSMFNSEVDLVFIFSTRDEANEHANMLKESGYLWFINGMKVPRFKSSRKQGYSVEEITVLVTNFWRKADAYEDVAEMLPAINSWEDLVFFRNFDDMSPLYAREVHEISWNAIMYMEIEKSAINLILSGKAGTAKTSFLRAAAYIFEEDRRVLQATNSTAKGITPSFSYDDPKDGYLCSPGFLKAIDEFFRYPLANAHATGIDKSARAVKDFVKVLIGILNHEEQRFASAKNNEYFVGMTASLIATDNLIEEVKMALAQLVVEDPAVLRRFGFIFLGDDEFEKVKSAQPPPPVDEYWDVMNDYWKSKYGYKVTQLKRFAHWGRAQLGSIKVDSKRSYDLMQLCIVEELKDMLSVRGTLGQTDEQHMIALAKDIDYTEHIRALVKCNCILRTVYETKNTTLPDKFKVTDADYDDAVRQFKRMIRDTIFLFEANLSQRLGGGGIVRI